MKRSLIIALVLSAPLHAQTPKTHSKFYNEEISALIMSHAPKLTKDMDMLENDRAFAIANIGAFSVVAGMPLLFAKKTKRAGTVVIAAGVGAVMTGMSMAANGEKSKMVEAIGEGESFRQLGSVLDKPQLNSKSFERLKTDLLDDIVNDVNLGASAAKRCIQFVKRRALEIAGSKGGSNSSGVSSDECEKAVLDSLGDPEVNSADATEGPKTPQDSTPRRSTRGKTGGTH